MMSYVDQMSRSPKTMRRRGGRGAPGSRLGGTVGRVLALFGVLAVGWVAGGCGTGEDSTFEPSQARSDESRILSPNVPQGDLDALVTGNTEFSFDLYQELAAAGSGNDNLFLSPFSISQALAMTYAGARGNTAVEMADTLHFSLLDARLHPAWNELDLTLASRGENAQASDGQGFRLHIVNSIWGQDGYPFEAPFLDTLALHYGAGINLVDFESDPEGCRDTINTWVENQTEGRIEDLLPPDVIKTITRLVLVNAIYFNAAWLHPFDEADTEDGTFHRVDGSQVTVPLMYQEESFRHATGDGWQAVELPYDGEELSMVVVLPDAGRFDEIDAGLDAASLDGMLAGLSHAPLALTLPKFSYTSSFMLKDTLEALGMVDAFQYGAADFSGIDGTQSLYIGAVIHKAFVDVNEAGTEAAAATAVVVDFGTSAPPTPTPMTVDRPFIFLIRDLQTGAILFTGRVMDPS